MISAGAYKRYFYFAQKARSDFMRARMRAMCNRAIAILTGRANCLASFGDAQESSRPRGQVYRGIREVPVHKIVGSVGRYRDFDRSFNPVRSNTRSRWERLDMAVLVGDDLPLVDLYLLGGYYYVKDGNHRVSVAKHRRMETIAAVVVEYLVDPPGAANHAAEAMCACAA